MNLIGELLLQKMCTISPEQLFMIAYIFGRIYVDEIRAFEKCVLTNSERLADRLTDSSFIHSHNYELNVLK